MKKVIKLSSVLLVIMLIAGTFYACKKESPVNPTDTSNVASVVEPQNRQGLISICCDVARPKFDCLTGGGLCNCRIRIGGCDGGARSRALDVKIVGNNLFIESDETFPTDAGLFVFDEATALEADVAKSLGFNQVIVQPGTYVVHQSANKQKVKLDVITN